MWSFRRYWPKISRSSVGIWRLSLFCASLLSLGCQSDDAVKADEGMNKTGSAEHSGRAPATVPDSSVLVLSITGEEGTRFSGEWVIIPGDGKSPEKHKRDGKVPEVFFYKGEGIAFTGEFRQLSEEGFLVIEVVKDGNVSRSRTRGMGSVVRIRSR